MMSETSPLVPIGQVARTAKIGRDTYRKAIAEGLITIAPERIGPGHGGGLAITEQDGELIIAVACAAALLGLSFMIIMRVVRATGATVTDGVLNLGTVPIPALSKAA